MATSVRRVAAPVATGLIVFSAMVLAVAVSSFPQVDGATLWSLPAAVTLAAVIRLGWWPVPVLVVAHLLGVVVVRGGGEPVALALEVSARTLVYAGAAMLARGRIDPPIDVSRRAVFALAFFAAPFVAAVAGSAAHTLMPSTPAPDVQLLRDLGGDVTALFTALPLLVTVANRWWSTLDRRWEGWAAVVAAVGSGTLGLLALDDVLPAAFLVCLAVAPIAAMQTTLLQSAAIPALMGLTTGVALAAAEVDLPELRAAQALLVMVGAVVASAHANAERVRQSHRATARRERQHATVLDSLAEGVLIIDGHRRLMRINPAGCTLLGVDATDVTGRTSADVWGTMRAADGTLLPADRMPGTRAVAGEEVEDEVYGIDRPDAGRGWYSITVRLLPEVEDPDEPAMIMTIRDVTDEVVADHAAEAEAVQLRHRALYDGLTGLANRTLLMDRMVRARRTADRRQSATGMLAVDLDGFKAVNDELGHSAGDEVLVGVALRLRTILRASDTAARLGGDEFVVLCEDLDPVSAQAELVGIAERLQGLLDQPYVTAVGQATLGASIGRALAGPGDPIDLELLARADQKMMADKRERKGLPERDTDGATDQDVPRGTDSSQPTVFIVDDDPEMALLAERILAASQSPFRVIGQTRDGATAIERILRDTPDLVLCDVIMPSMSGLEVVEQVRRRRPEQTFVFWSMMPPPALERHRRELGVPFVQKDRIEELPRALLDAASRPAGGDPQGPG